LSNLHFGQEGRRKTKTRITLYFNEDELTKLLEAKYIVAGIYNLFECDEKIRKAADQVYDGLEYLVQNSGREEYLYHNNQEEE